MMFETFWYVVAAVIGASVGSFLNVAIYRVPLGMSVNEPKRSFCPGCKKPIPWYRNLPVLTWIIQRGRCAGCDGKIAVRYVMVELLTAILFVWVWHTFPNPSAILGWIFVSLLVSISFIDGEHTVIPVNWCWVAIVLAVVGSFFAPAILNVDQYFIMLKTPNFLDSISGKGDIGALMNSFVGAVCGYVGLVGVVLFGKLVFGKKKVELDKPEKWFLKEPNTEEEELEFVLGDEHIGWGEVFYRKTDRMELTGSEFMVDGNPVSGTSMTIRQYEAQIGDEIFKIENIKSLEGKASKVVIPREAMGGGDPPFLGMIGAFLGAPAVLFTIFSSSVYAIIAAILGRVGFGKPLPFGPFMALGALTWMFGGYKWFASYLSLIGY